MAYPVTHRIQLVHDGSSRSDTDIKPHFLICVVLVVSERESKNNKKQFLKMNSNVAQNIENVSYILTNWGNNHSLLVKEC